MKKIYIWILAAAAAAGLSGCGRTDADPAAEGAVGISAGEDLVIPISEVTDTASFYHVSVEGTEMEVLAIRDSSGNIRTAFNTCQSCYTSGNGRYEAENTELVCQNCGFHFTADQISEREGGGCNPWAIGDANRTVTDDAITISYDFLKESKNIFSNWK